MKRRRQSGQALIMALILLAIGTVIMVPSLALTQNAVKNSKIITQRAHDFYAADAAQEFTMWKLLYTSYISQFTYDGQSDNFSVNVCGTPVNVSVIMRALASFQGVTLIGDTPIRPTKEVSPISINSGTSQTYNFTITMEQLGSNTSQGLDAVYDILPDGFTDTNYVANSTQLSEDGGITWQNIGDPLIENSQTWPSGGPAFGGRVRLRWPNPNTYGQSNFASPTRDFIGGQIKKIRYKMTSTLTNNNKYHNYFYSWVVLKPWNTLSGPTGIIDVVNTSKSGTAYTGGLIDVSTTANVSFVPPGQTTDIKYVITVKDQTGAANNKISNLVDYLPPGFSFVGMTSPYDLIPTSNTTNFGYVNGVYRQTCNFTFSPSASFDVNNQRQFAFIARTSENVSGSYYNEVIAVTTVGIPQIFSTPGVSLTATNFNTGYTWNSAAVVIPAYDTSAQAGNVTTNANLAVTSRGVAISSYQIR